MRELSKTRTCCILYDNQFLTPRQIKELLIDSSHQTQPVKDGIVILADLISCIHRDVTARAKSCSDCFKKSKNLNAVILKTIIGILPPVNEPDEEVQIDFPEPIPSRNNKTDYYILASVDRLSRYAKAQEFKDHDTTTAISYLEDYCSFHGTSRALRSDQAQAFKAHEFEIFWFDKNIKLIIAPVLDLIDLRATGMVERMVQAIKRKLSLLESDPLLSDADLAGNCQETNRKHQVNT